MSTLVPAPERENLYMDSFQGGLCVGRFELAWTDHLVFNFFLPPDNS